MRKLPALLCVLALVLGLAAGCSSGGSDDKASGSTTKPAGSGDKETGDRSTTTTTEAGSGSSTSGGTGSKAYAAAIAKNLEASTIGLGAAPAACLGKKWVGLLGVERFTKAKVNPADITKPEWAYTTLALTEKEAKELIGFFPDCKADPVDVFVSGVGTGLNDTQKACIAAKVRADLVTDVLALSLQGIDMTSEQRREINELDPLCNLSAQGG